MSADNEMYCILCNGRGMDSHDLICARCHGTGYEPEILEAGDGPSGCRAFIPSIVTGDYYARKQDLDLR